MSSTHYKFDCGCEIPITDPEKKECDGLPSMYIPYDDLIQQLNYGHSCPKVFELLKQGKTKGVFQLESYLGKDWSRRLEPDTMEEWAALIALIRPGALRGIMKDKSGDEKSMTERYVDRKHKREKVESIHDSVNSILSPTQSVMVFQEQAMQIACKIAGFSEQEADKLRKAIGKKKADIMAEVKKIFLEGCEREKIVTTEEAEYIFGIIQESQKYSFNKSHSVGYGITGYLTAYVKAHLPLHFFCSWLYYARDKIDPQKEVRDLVSDTKGFNIDVFGPEIKYIGRNHSNMAINDGHINFGLVNVKKIGKTVIDKFIEKAKKIEEECNVKMHEMSWIQFLIFISPEISKTTMNGLIMSGALDRFGIGRNMMSYEYINFSKLTKKEQSNLKDIYSPKQTLTTLLEQFVGKERKDGGPSNKNRVKIVQDIITVLKSPPYSNQDNHNSIIKIERELFGVPLTCSPTSTTHFVADTTCKEFNDGKNATEMSLCGEVTRVKEYTIKNGKSAGKKMCWCEIEDETGTVNCVAFGETWEDNQHVIYENSCIFAKGKRSEKGGFVINEVFVA